MGSERVIEVTGEDVEAAIANGLAELGVGPNEVIVEVLEEPSRGMFGLKPRPARVRLQLMAARTPPPAPPVPAQPVEPVAEADETPETVEVTGPVDEDAEVCKVVLEEILEKLEFRARVAIRRSSETDEDDEGEMSSPWILDVTGSSDLNALIGRRGETLASLQYITRLITSRELQRRANIIVDVDGYKARRTTKLHELAMRMADQATSENRTISLEPMPPYERRIIHLALRGRSDVETASVGEGELRKVTIVPK